MPGVTVRYNDLIVRIFLSLVAAHILVSLGERRTFFELLLIWDYWRSLLLSAIIAFALISIVYVWTVWLDGRFDWIAQPLVRTLLQALCALGIPAIIAFLLADIYFRAYGIDIFHTIYLKFDYPFVVLMLLMLNIYYVAFYFFRQWQAAHTSRALNSSTGGQQMPTDVFVVSKGAENIPLPLAVISYFFHEGQYNFLRTFNNESFLIPDTLDSIENRMPNKLFFRVNRQIIINQSALQKFEPADYGKLKLYLDPPMKETIIVSQRRAKQFKEWLAG